MAAESTVLTVYSRTYCHLCDEMIAGLRVLQTRLRFDLEVVDVDAQPVLEERYGERVPVLAHGDRELCHYRLDVPAVTDYLAKIEEFSGLDRKLLKAKPDCSESES